MGKRADVLEAFQADAVFPQARPNPSSIGLPWIVGIFIVFLSWVIGVSMHEVSLSSRGVLDWEAAGDGAEIERVLETDEGERARVNSHLDT